MKNVDKIWLERVESLEQLFSLVKWLLVNNKPRNQKIAIWQERFSSFSWSLYDQDLCLLREIEVLQK